MPKIKRAARFVLIHLFRNPVYLLTYALTFFLRDFKLNVNFFTKEELISLIKEGRSLIRLGDGEIYLMNFGSIHYQKYDPLIRKKLFEIIRDYKNDSPYILAINEHVMHKSNEELRKEGKFHVWLPMKVFYFLFFKENVKYADASLFYYKNAFEEYFEKYLMDKEIIVMSEEKNVNSLKTNNSIPFKNIKYIVTPKENAQGDIPRLKKELEELLNNSTQKPVVLAGFSIAGKLLAYELANRVQIIDIGVGIELMYTGKNLEYMLMSK